LCLRTRQQVQGAAKWAKKNHHHWHHHLTVMGLGHLLTHSGLPHQNSLQWSPLVHSAFWSVIFLLSLVICSKTSVYMLCEEMNNANKKSECVSLIDFRVLSQIQVSKDIQ
jgi:hypothetical protein